MRSLFVLAVAVCVSLSSTAWAQSSLSSGPESAGNSGANKATTNQSSPVQAPTPPGEGASSGASGASMHGTEAPTAPQEKQDARESGELSPSQHNDPGEKTSPPSPEQSR
jgi:hypothetical protein